MPLLEVEGLHAGYGDVPVLNGVSFAIEAGSVTALIGVNGAGKTTLLRTISGILRPVRGTVRFDGRDITRAAPEDIVAAGVAQAPEGRRLFTAMSIYENLLVGASAKRARARRAESLALVFELFPKLAERRTQLAGTLSGGEQQMVAIGRALMCAPRLLLLDETSLGLAPIVVDEIFEAIGKLASQGMTILVVEQNTALALDAALYGYVIEHGRMTLDGPAADLAQNAQVRRAYLGI